MESDASKAARMQKEQDAQNAEQDAARAREHGARSRDEVMLAAAERLQGGAARELTDAERREILRDLVGAGMVLAQELRSATLMEHFRTIVEAEPSLRPTHPFANYGHAVG